MKYSSKWLCKSLCRVAALSAKAMSIYDIAMTYARHSGLMVQLDRGLSLNVCKVCETLEFMGVWLPVVFKDLINLYVEHIDIIYDASEDIFFRLELGIKLGYSALSALSQLWLRGEIILVCTINQYYPLFCILGPLVHIVKLVFSPLRSKCLI